MSIAQRIAANRAARERRSVEVAEWGEDDAPLLIYYSDVSAREIEKIRNKHKDFLNNPSMSAMVEIIIMKAENEAGDKIFTLEDKPVLMGEPVDLVANIFGSVFSSEPPEVKEKN